MNKLKQQFKKIITPFRGVGSDADTDWKIMIVIFIILLTLSLVIHVGTIIDINKGNTDGITTGYSTQKVIDNKSLLDVVNMYKTRQDNFINNQSREWNLVDPAE